MRNRSSTASMSRFTDRAMEYTPGMNAGLSGSARVATCSGVSEKTVAGSYST